MRVQPNLALMWQRKVYSRLWRIHDKRRAPRERCHVGNVSHRVKCLSPPNLKLPPLPSSPCRVGSLTKSPESLDFSCYMNEARTDVVVQRNYSQSFSATVNLGFCKVITKGLAVDLTKPGVALTNRKPFGEGDLIHRLEWGWGAGKKGFSITPRHLLHTYWHLGRSESQVFLQVSLLLCVSWKGLQQWHGQKAAKRHGGKSTWHSQSSALISVPSLLITISIFLPQMYCFSASFSR